MVNRRKMGTEDDHVELPPVDTTRTGSDANLVHLNHQWRIAGNVRLSRFAMCLIHDDQPHYTGSRAGVTY